MSKLKKYLLFTFISTLIISLIGAHDYNTGHIGGLMGFSYSLSISMLIPTIGAFIAGADFKKNGLEPEIHPKCKAISFHMARPYCTPTSGSRLIFYGIPRRSGYIMGLLQGYRTRNLRRSHCKRRILHRTRRKGNFQFL